MGVKYCRRIKEVWIYFSVVKKSMHILTLKFSITFTTISVYFKIPNNINAFWYSWAVSILSSSSKLKSVIFWHLVVVFGFCLQKWKQNKTKPQTCVLDIKMFLIPDILHSWEVTFLRSCLLGRVQPMNSCFLIYFNLKIETNF